MRLLIFAAGWLLLGGPAAEAHGFLVRTHAPAWTFDPWVVVPLQLSLALHAAGTVELWTRAGIGRGVRVRQTLLYAAGWLALAGALVSPLHWLGEQLFTAHMIEHEIVMAVAAPLLVLARPGGAVIWAFPSGMRRELGQLSRAAPVRAVWAWITRPLTATVLHGAAIWAWHIPSLFDAAVMDVGLHRLQHLSFFLTAMLFWWSLLRRANPGTAAGDLFVTMIHTSILGALLTFAPRVLYSVQTAGALRWGLTPLEDQQLAGLVMWVPASTIYAGAALALTALWVRRSGAVWKSGDALRAP